MPPIKPKPTPTPKPRISAEDNKNINKDFSKSSVMKNFGMLGPNFKGVGATGQYTDPVLKAKHNLVTASARYQDKLNKESFGKKLNRAFNAFDMNQYAENAAHHQRMLYLEDIYNKAVKDAKKKPAQRKKMK